MHDEGAGARSGDGDLAAADARDIRAWLAWLHDKKLAKSSIARKLATVRSCFRYLARVGRVEINTARQVGSPRLPKRLPSFLPKDESKELLDADTERSEAGLRDHALLELLYATGLRVAECCGLDLDDVDRRRGAVRVMGKGGKERVVPAGDTALAALEAWLSVRGEARGALFTNPRGSTGYGRDFRNANKGEWGHADSFDMIDGARWAAGQPWSDGQLAIYGGSYGGYLTALGLARLVLLVRRDQRRRHGRVRVRAGAGRDPHLQADAVREVALRPRRDVRGVLLERVRSGEHDRLRAGQPEPRYELPVRRDHGRAGLAGPDDRQDAYLSHRRDLLTPLPEPRPHY